MSIEMGPACPGLAASRGPSCCEGRWNESPHPLCKTRDKAERGNLLCPEFSAGSAYISFCSSARFSRPLTLGAPLLSCVAQDRVSFLINRFQIKQGLD